MIKHIEIDENAIFEELLQKMEKSYNLSFVDRDSALSPKTINDILKNGLEDQIYDVFADQQRYYATLEANRLLDKAEGLDKDQKNLFKETDEYDNLIMEIESRDESEAEKEIFIKTRTRCRVTLHSNYDCWTDIADAGGLYGKNNALEGMMKALSLNPAKVKEEAIRQGVTCHRAFPNVKSREGKEVVGYEDFVTSLCECPNYGLWTFFGILDTQAVWESGFKTDDLVIPAGTWCGIYNSWNGGGTCWLINTIRPISLATLNKRAASQYDSVAIHVDERFEGCNGYPSCEVYGGTLSNKEILCKA